MSKPPIQASFIFLSLFLSMSAFTAPPKDQKKEKKKPVVFTEIVKSSKTFDRLTYPAQVTPRIHAAVLADTKGFVEKIHIPLGGYAKKGARLITLRNPDPIYQYAPVIIRSPVNGKVSQLFVSTGSQVVTNQKLLTVTDPKSLELKMELISSDLNKVKSDSKGTFFPSLSDQTQKVAVQVKGISPLIDSATGTAVVELALESTSIETLRPGLIGKVIFEINERNSILVPERALSYRGQEPFIYQVIDGKAHKVQIKVGKRSKDLIEITEGLKAGQEIVVRSSQFVGDKAEVEIYKPEKETAPEKKQTAKNASDTKKS